MVSARSLRASFIERQPRSAQPRWTRSRLYSPRLSRDRPRAFGANASVGTWTARNADSDCSPGLQSRVTSDRCAQLRRADAGAPARRASPSSRFPPPPKNPPEPTQPRARPPQPPPQKRNNQNPPPPPPRRPPRSAQGAPAWFSPSLPEEAFCWPRAAVCSPRSLAGLVRPTCCGDGAAQFLRVPRLDAVSTDASVLPSAPSSRSPPAAVRWCLPAFVWRSAGSNVSLPRRWPLGQLGGSRAAAQERARRLETGLGTLLSAPARRLKTFLYPAR